MSKCDRYTLAQEPWAELKGLGWDGELREGMGREEEGVEVSKRPEQGNRFSCVFLMFYEVFRDRHAKQPLKHRFFMHPRAPGGPRGFPDVPGGS